MRSQIILLSFLSGTLASVFRRGACNADNCARAVTGTRYALDVQASHTADCSSFMMETITPAVPTTTVTVTGTSYSVVGSNAKRTAAPVVKKDNIERRDAAGNAFLLPPPSASLAAMLASASATGIQARQVTAVPNAVPIYASACSGVVRYSSACSCAGITVETTYAPTPATFTSTVYAQESVIPVCDPTQNYGYNYYGGSIEGDVLLAPEFIQTDEQGCCAACYTEGSACLIYEFLGSVCLIAYEFSGSNTPTDYCPYGVFGVSIGPGSFYGLGPCGVSLPS